jgi:hypothetical protein
MSKTMLTTLMVISLVASIFMTVPNTEAAKAPTYTEASSSISSQNNISSLSSSSSNLNKQKPVIFEGELDIEFETKITKDQEKMFNQCKKEERLRRSKRNQKKSTACRKIPTKVNEELTDQD